jgi:hypothetical protein
VTRPGGEVAPRSHHPATPRPCRGL